MMRARCLSLLSLILASTSLASATPSTADADLRAELMPGSMQVKPLGEWGALQTGRHTFHGQDEHGKDVLLERGTFMHIWERSEQGWHIKRVISYDHESESSTAAATPRR